jgi:hypothetical protein
MRIPSSKKRCDFTDRLRGPLALQPKHESEIQDFGERALRSASASNWTHLDARHGRLECLVYCPAPSSFRTSFVRATITSEIIL